MIVLLAIVCCPLLWQAVVKNLAALLTGKQPPAAYKLGTGFEPMIVMGPQLGQCQAATEWQQLQGVLIPVFLSLGCSWSQAC